MAYTTLDKDIKDIAMKYWLNNTLLREEDAIIAGSTALDIYIRATQKRSINPADIDIFFSESADIDRVVEDFKNKGYNIETNKENNKVQEYTFAGDIKKVITCVLYDKLYVQLIVVEGDHRQFIVEKTDLSITGLYYDFRRKCIYGGEGIARRDIDRGIMYISKIYNDVMRGVWGASRKQKLLDRIAKYEARGFRFID